MLLNCQLHSSLIWGYILCLGIKTLNTVLRHFIIGRLCSSSSIFKANVSDQKLHSLRYTCSNVSQIRLYMDSQISDCSVCICLSAYLSTGFWIQLKHSTGTSCLQYTANTQLIYQKVNFNPS